MKPRITRKVLLASAVILLSGSMVVYAATLFTQTFPAVSIPPGITSSCAGGTLTYEPTNSQVIGTGAVAELTFDCGSSSFTPAFTTKGSTSDVVNATPTFTVPTGWSLYIFASVNCGGIVTEYALTSGTPVSMQGGTNYWYCLETNSATQVSSFTITWSQ